MDDGRRPRPRLRRKYAGRTRTVHFKPTVREGDAARRPSSGRTPWTGRRSIEPASRSAAPSGSSSSRRPTRTGSPDGEFARVARGFKAMLTYQQGGSHGGSRGAQEKYGSVIDYGKDEGQLEERPHREQQAPHPGRAPNDAIKNEVWIKIKDIDPRYEDLTADITIDASLKAPEQTYTVVAAIRCRRSRSTSTATRRRT